MGNVKRIPYGVSNFLDIVQRNQYYVDKTMYIPKLEAEADSLFFIRPRRFGKSLLLSMLRAYYDINMKDRFQELFGNLWIGSHPTPEQGLYQVLLLDFSKITGNIETLPEEFNIYCNIRLNDFIERYKDYYSAEFVQAVKAEKRAYSKLNMIDIQAKNRNIPLYLLVDEYDSLTNVVLKEHGEKIYRSLELIGGFYSDVFNIFKGKFCRSFISGLSPIALDDLIDGFNSGWHISTKPAFNQMLGFSTKDVREMFQYYKENGVIGKDSDIKISLEELKSWYGNYCFSENALETQSEVFNCDMVLNYLNKYMKIGKSPEQLIPLNTKTDYDKTKKLLQLNKLNGDHKRGIYKIAEKGEVVSNLETSASAKDLLNPNIFFSLLFSYGMLTIKGTRGDMMILGIPNNNVRKYLMEQYGEKIPLDIEVEVIH